MTLSGIVELVFGWVMVAFILYMIVLVFFGLFSDSKKPRRRRRTPSYPKYTLHPTRSTDFDYFHSYDKTEFLVYFVENSNLNSLKIGVGTGGRLLQLLNSHSSQSETSNNIGWKVLRIAKFSNSESDYLLGKIYGNEAEKRAHFYWRNTLKLPIHLYDFQMGYSKVINYGKTNWVTTKGFTETAELGKVCEVSTWNYVTKSPGLITESNKFMGYEARDLKLLFPNDAEVEAPIGYSDFHLQRVRHSRHTFTQPAPEQTVEEKFWKRVDKESNGCWLWTGSVTKKGESGAYALFSHEGRNELAQRVAWALAGLETINNSTLENSCGTRICVNPEHWKKTLRRRNTFGEKRISSFQCTKEGCNRPSETVTKAALCEPCRQSIKRKRRGRKISTYKCLNDGCDNPAVTMTKSSICEPCRQKVFRQQRRIGGYVTSKIKKRAISKLISTYKCVTEGCDWPSDSMTGTDLCVICKKNNKT